MSSRNTPRRRVIRAAIDRAGRPMDAHEVFAAAQSGANKLGLATVYRTLKLGIDEGWMTPVDLPNAPTRYEMSGKKHHHHFECRRSSRVFEVEGCPAT